MTFISASPEWVTLNNYDPSQIQRRVDTVANPTFSGNTIGLTVPGHEIWHPLVIRFDVTASAVVGNRFARLVYRFQNSTTFPVVNGIALVASNSVHIVNMLGVTIQQTETVGSVVTLTTWMPDAYLGPGDGLQLVVNGIQAGDTCTQFQLVNDVMFTEPNAPPPPAVSPADRLADTEHVLELQGMPGIR